MQKIISLPLKSFSKTMKIPPTLHIHSIRSISHKILIRGFEEKSRPKDIHNIFNKYGKITKVRVSETVTTVIFESLDSAISAKDELDKTLVGGKRLHISFSEEIEEKSIQEKYEEFISRPPEVIQRPPDRPVPRAWLDELARGGSGAPLGLSKSSDQSPIRTKEKLIPSSLQNRHPDLVFDEIPTAIFKRKSRMFHVLRRFLSETDKFLLPENPNKVVVWLKNSQHLENVVKSFENKTWKEKDAIWRIKPVPFTSYPANFTWQYKDKIAELKRDNNEGITKKEKKN